MHSAGAQESCKGGTHGIEKAESKEISKRWRRSGGGRFGGWAIGSASAQTVAPEAHPQKRLKDLVAYGERSRFVTSVRVPVAERDFAR